MDKTRGSRSHWMQIPEARSGLPSSLLGGGGRGPRVHWGRGTGMESMDVTPQLPRLLLPNAKNSVYTLVPSQEQQKE